MSEETSFDEMLKRLRAADPGAANELFRRYSHRLVSLARSRLQGMKRKIDGEDVMQSVFRSFFSRQRDDRLELRDWNSLWSLLACITLRKCGHKIEYYLAECRDLRRESAVVPSSSEDSVASWIAIARDPTPVEAAMLTETVEQLLSSLTDRDRKIVESSLQGDSMEEISRATGCSERTVARVRQRLREQLEQLIG